MGVLEVAEGSAALGTIEVALGRSSPVQRSEKHKNLAGNIRRLELAFAPETFMLHANNEGLEDDQGYKRQRHNRRGYDHAGR